MGNGSEEKLDRLLKEAYPAVEVSPDFTLRLWRRLMKSPLGPSWMPPVPALELAAALGIMLGLWSWVSGPLTPAGVSQGVRWDLYGNAPVDTMAGSYLNLIREG